MALLDTIAGLLSESGFVFDVQQRLTNHSSMARAFSRYVVPGKRVLDLGCATSGCVHHVWGSTQMDYTGVDLTAGFLRYAKSHHPKATLLRGDIGALPFKTLPFDYVCMFSVIHHLDGAIMGSLAKFLGKKLSPQARVLISEPIFPPESASPSFSDRLSRMLLEHDRGDYIRTPEAYRALFAEGFDVVNDFRFKCSMHHFCGFELQRKKG